jgi:rhodanese-related sulfurtransferase
MNTRTRSHEDIYDKAKRILSDPARVVTLENGHGDYWIGYVTGDHGTYKAAAVSEDYAESIDHPRDKRYACYCRAGRVPIRCSHMLVAEEMRLRGEDS